MKVYNPTENSVSVLIKGVTYTVGAESSVENVPAEHAEYWVNMLHNFMEVSEDGTPEMPMKEDAPEEVPMPEEAPEVTPEEAPEAPEAAPEEEAPAMEEKPKAKKSKK